jgi:TonB-linked SusC/RagA family outer membrane protein
MKKIRKSKLSLTFSIRDGFALKKFFRMMQFTSFFFFLGLFQLMAVNSYSDIRYSIIDQQIILPKLDGISGIVTEQQKTVSGKVTDSTGAGLPGVSVVVKSTTNGCITDANGKYTLSKVPADAILQFSFVGMKKQEVKVAGKTTINVTLEDDAIGLDEVVAIGYGTMKKTDLTGSIASVGSAELKNAVINTPDQALQGKVAGVQVRTDSHAPGGGISVQVRGTSSLSASGQPLYVVDGFPISNEFVTVATSESGEASSPNPLNSIDPSNIESIEILKDASATAIYGSRATNGVVLITTKRGAGGKAKIEFENSQSVDYCSKYLEVLGAKEWAGIMNEANDQNGKAHTFTDAAIAAMGDGTDWQREVYRSAIGKKYKLSVSGGTPDLRYLVSGNYSDQDGIVKGTNFKRYSANVNIDANLNKKISMGSSIMFSNSVETMLPNDSKGYSSSASVVSNIFNAPVHVPAKDADGNYTFFSNYIGGNSAGDNPLYMVDNYDINANTTRLLGSVFANFKIIDGLEFKVRLGIDYRDWRYKSYYPIKSIAAMSLKGSASQISEKTMNVLNENVFEYKKTFAGKHQISAMVGFTNQSEKDEYIKAVGYGFPSDAYKYNNMGIATTQSNSSQATKWTLLSYIGRVNYSFNSKYLVTATARYDGSSKFGANNKYGFFPSVAGAWRMSEENFIKQLNVFSNLKLRVGYGTTGNERIGLYNSLATISSDKDYNSGYVFGGTLAGVAYPKNISNPDLTWEKSADVNLGVDLGFFNNRINLTVDVYKKKTTALLLNVPLPTESGYTSVMQNVGSMENKGIEFSIQSTNIKSSSLSWTTNFNLSVNRNKILDLGGQSQMFAGWVGGGNSSLNGGNIVRLAPGKPVGSFYGVVWEGIWKSAEEIASVGTMKSAKPGSARLKDVNKSGTFDANDCQYIGNPNPDFTFGFSNDFSYKQWSLSVYTYGEIGQDIAAFKRLFAAGTAVYAPDRRDRWTPSNINGTRLAASAGYPSMINSDEIYDGSFVRIKTIVLGYSLPVRKLNIRFLESAKISVSAENPFTFTKYPYYDPEINSFGSSNSVKGVDRFSYPASKAFRVGINVCF